MRTAELFERPAQDELLQMRNDLMTVYREVVPGGGALFPLRYARLAPSHRAPAPSAEIAPPRAPVLVIPGGPGRASVLPYDALRRALSAQGLDVLMVEHRGVGLSRLDAEGEDLPDAAMRLPAVLDDLVAVLDHARVEAATVYGCGYGAYLAQALAALHPERVRSLVLDSPQTSADDELVAQAALRDAYWDGTRAATSTTAAALRRLAEHEVIDPHRAGPVVLAVHDHGGPSAVRDLVDLLVVDRGRLTWHSVRQVLNQGWLQSTPYVIEHDLTAHIAHTELGIGSHADGGPLDPLVLAGEQARAVPPFAGEQLDLAALAPRIEAPTLVVSGTHDLVTPPLIAHRLAARIPGAGLLSLAGAGHAMLDTRPQIAQVLARWSACGTAHALVGRGAELMRLPAATRDQTLGHGLRLALAAERHAPWRLWVESARERRDRSLVDPTARRSRRVKLT